MARLPIAASRHRRVLLAGAGATIALLAGALATPSLLAPAAATAPGCTVTCAPAVAAAGLSTGASGAQMPGATPGVTPQAGVGSAPTTPRGPGVTPSAPAATATAMGQPGSALRPAAAAPSPSLFTRHPGPIARTSPFMRTCGTQFCIGGLPFYPFGATFYQSTAQSGIDNPLGTVLLAQQERLNTIRIVNFYNPTTGDPAVTPFSEAVWSKVDTLIADAQGAGIRVVLDLADYRNILLDHCTNPYTYDWTRFLTFVAQRVNHVTGRLYAADPEIVMVSFSGEPLPVGTHGCISYTTADLTGYFHAVAATWKSLDGNHLVTGGGLGYLDFNSGIDWRAIVADADVDVCAFKTYGGMRQWVGTGAAYCAGLGKPWFNDEWGYQQSEGDAAMAAQFQAQFDNNAANGCAGNFFWNAGYQVAATTYDVGPQTPLTLAAVQRNAR